MKLVEPNVEYLEQPKGIDGIYKMIEMAGRTCYKSEDKITEDSAKAFVDKLISAKHLSMLEHGTVYLLFDMKKLEDYQDYRKVQFDTNPYSEYDVLNQFVYVTTNMRVLVEHDAMDFLLKYLIEPTSLHERRHTLKIVTDRGVSHEIVRSRSMSFAQESTRYCCYTKAKFGGEVTFIKPSDYDTNSLCSQILIDSYKQSEFRYIQAISLGVQPQIARQVLPNGLKTEIVVTGFESDWKHFFNLRLRGITGKPHPDMQRVAQLAWDVFKERGISL